MNSQSVDCENPTTQPSSKWQHKAILIFVLCILPFLAVFFSWERLTSRRYQATAFLQFGFSWECLDAYNSFKGQQEERLHNRLLLNAALSKPCIANLACLRNQDDPIGWITQNLEASFPGDADIMKVSLSGAGRKECALIANAVVDVYIQQLDDEYRERLEDRIGELKKIQTEKTEEVKAALIEVREMYEKSGKGCQDSLSAEQSSILEKLVDFRTELSRGRSELSRMNTELAAQKELLQSMESTPVSGFEFMLACPSDYFLNKLAEEILARDIVSDRETQAELNRLKGQYSKALEQSRVEIIAQRKTDIEVEVKKLETAIDGAREKQKVTEEELRNLRNAAEWSTSTRDLGQMRNAINTTQKALDDISEEIESLQIELRTRPRVNILQKAEVPASP